MGWDELVSWEDGLKRTVEWYRKYSGNWDNVESALVAHPRRGLTAEQLRGREMAKRASTPKMTAPAADDA